MALTENYDLYYTENNDDPTFLSWRNNIAGPNGNMVKIDAALASVLPSQSGNNGKFLTTNGSATSWATVDALPSQSGNSGKYLTTNGSAASWADAPEEVFIAEHGVTTWADLSTAYNADKICYVRINDDGYEWLIPVNFPIYGGANDDTIVGLNFCGVLLNGTPYDLAYGYTSITSSGGWGNYGWRPFMPSQSNNSGKFLTTNGMTTSWANAPTEFFMAEAGVTDYSQVLDAYNANKTIICWYEDIDYYEYYPLIEHNSSDDYFVFARATANGTEYIVLDINDGWHNVVDTTYVPSIRKVNNKALSSDITLTASDVGAQPTLPTQSGNSGKFLTTNGTDVSWSTVDSLPSQSGNSGKFLTTNGTAASWATVDALPSQSGNSGKFLTTNGSAASWATVDALPSQTGNSGKVLGTNGTTASWVDAQGASVTINTWALSSP